MRIFGVGAVLVIVGVIAIGIIGNPQEPTLKQKSKIQKDGNSIVKALDAYKLDNGCYPTVLQDLVPKYLVEVPIPMNSTQSWKYGHPRILFENGKIGQDPDVNKFYLSIGEIHSFGSSWSYRYRSTSKEWKYIVTDDNK